MFNTIKAIIGIDFNKVNAEIEKYIEKHNTYPFLIMTQETYDFIRCLLDQYEFAELDAALNGKAFTTNDDAKKYIAYCSDDRCKVQIDDDQVVGYIYVR